MTKLNVKTQLAGEATGDDRVYVQRSDGTLVFARLDAATLELVPAATPNQPPVLRAKPQSGASRWVKDEVPTVVTPTQGFTLSRVPLGPVDVYRNGLLMKSTVDYTSVGQTVTFRPEQPIVTGDEVVFKYEV